MAEFEQAAQALLQELHRLQAEERGLRTKVGALESCQHDLRSELAELQEQLAPLRAERDRLIKTFREILKL